MWKQLLLVQLLCVSLAWHVDADLPSYVRSAAPNAKFSIMPPQEFISGVCQYLEEDLKMIPWPVQMGGLCDNLGINDPKKTEKICPMVDVMKMLLGNFQSMYPMQCAPDAIRPPRSSNPSGEDALPAPLTSQIADAGLPARFPAATAARLLEVEGPTYYWLYKHMSRLMAWAPCGVLGQNVPWVKPQGWDVLAILNAAADLRAYGLGETAMPFAAVLRRVRSPATAAECTAFVQGHPELASSSSKQQDEASRICAGDEIVVLVRGTTSAYDWFYNLDYGMSTNTNYGQGLLHKGFQRLANTLWDGGLKRALDRYSASASSVVVSGHSLGAATAALLAARIEKYFAASTNPAGTPSVTAVLFGSPNVGDATFSADYNGRINTRNIAYIHDIVTQVPCVGNMVECLPRQGPAEAPAGQAGGNMTVNFLAYDRLGGGITLTADGMPAQQKVWSELSLYTQDEFCGSMATMANLAEATHICSYMCAFSNSSTTTRGDWCLLWEGNGAEAAGTATFCMDRFSFVSDHDFPTVPRFPSVKGRQGLSPPQAIHRRARSATGRRGAATSP